MKTRTLGQALIVACAFLALHSMANTLPAATAAEMMTVKMMDKNKDGMVSKAEFLEMAGKVYDMKAKEMSAKGGMLTAEQFDTMRKTIYMSFQQ